MKKKSVALMMALAVAAGAVSGCGALSLGGSDTGAVPAASEAAGGEHRQQQRLAAATHLKQLK